MLLGSSAGREDSLGGSWWELGSGGVSLLLIGVYIYIYIYMYTYTYLYIYKRRSITSYTVDLSAKRGATDISMASFLARTIQPIGRIPVGDVVDLSLDSSCRGPHIIACACVRRVLRVAYLPDQDTGDARLNSASWRETRAQTRRARRGRRRRPAGQQTYTQASPHQDEPHTPQPEPQSSWSSSCVSCDFRGPACMSHSPGHPTPPTPNRPTPPPIHFPLYHLSGSCADVLLLLLLLLLLQQQPLRLLMLSRFIIYVAICIYVCA
jgi:hypothetical protein